MTGHQMIVLMGWVMLAMSAVIALGLAFERRARAYPRALRVGYGILGAGSFLSGLAAVLRAPDAGESPALSVAGQILMAAGVAIQVWVVMRSDRRPPS